MAFQYLFDPNKQFQSIGGVNEVSGFLRVFLNGTDDRATTYKNFDGTLNEADIVLDSYGRAVVIVDDTKTYRIEVYNRLGGLMWTVSNYKASGGSGGGSGTPVSVEGTVGEIDVDENTEGGVKHFVVGLAATIKNAITALQLAVNSIGLSLNGKKDKQSPVSVSGGTTKTLVGISQDADGLMTPEFDDIAFPDWTSAINAAVATCEKLENKKTTLTGYERSNTYYPTIKAVVDFVNGMLQNLGGKLITDNGDPFTSSASLPSSTPYGGVDIADKDYAYIQGVGTAERWSATVSGSSVTWLQEYAISIPVFTPAQQAAIDSGATSTKVGNYDAHLANTNNPHGVTAAQVGALTPTGNGSGVTATFTAAGSRVNISTGEKLSVIFGKIAKWLVDLKAVAFSGSYNDLSNRPTIGSGTLTIQKNGTDVTTFGANQTGNSTANIAVPTKTSELTNDSNFLTTNGDGSNVTASFTASGTRTNISTGEKLSVIFGKIAKWFSDLKSLAFKDKVSDSDISGTIADTHIASASTWNGKQNPIGINPSSGNENLFLTQKGSWLSTPNEIVIIDNTFDVDSVLSLISAGKTPVYKYGANYLYNLENYQESGANRFATFTQSRLDNIYILGPSGLQKIKVTYIYQSTVTTSGWSNDSYYTYGSESLVSSIAPPYIDNVHFPTTKAVSDFVDQAISGVGGKQITDSGLPFTSSASLPSSTPYGGQNIASNDYAYVQQGYTITRYVASVSGSSVTWSESFSIDTSAFLTVPIDFTEAQTVENINANETLPTILGKIKKWFTDKISQLGNLAFLDKVGNAQISGTINDSHIASADTWNAKAEKAPSSGSGTLAVIDSNGNYSSSGITAYSQTQYNNQTERLAAWLSSFTSMSHAFNVVFNGTQISKTISFENEFTGVKYLRLGIAYFSGEIQYYLPFSGKGSEYNGWIIEPDTSQKYGLSTMHSTHNFAVQGTSNNEELFDETELGTTGQSVEIIFEKAINTSHTVRGRISSELRLINIPSNDTLFVHIDLAYERLSSNGSFYAFGTVFVNTEATEL